MVRRSSTEKYVHVEHRRALVALCNGVVGVVRRLRSSDNMTPHDSDLVTSLHIDDFGGYGCAEARIAGNACVVDI